MSVIMLWRTVSCVGLLPMMRSSRTMKCLVFSSTVVIGSTCERLLDVHTVQKRLICVNACLRKKTEDSSEKRIVPIDFFESLSTKNKETYLEAVRIYESRAPMRRSHVEFIYAALRHMEEFGVHTDLDAYKKLIDVFPKGPFIPTNLMQVEFMHYPKQQQCAIDVLEQMEVNGVIPDSEMEEMLVNVFGKLGHPVRKYARMMYWMPKFKNLSPWPVPKPPPEDPLELAKLALERMSSVDLQSKVEVFQADQLEDSIDHTWIVSAQSIVQQELLEKHPTDLPIFVEGAFRVWLRDASVNYFILRADPISKPEPEILDTDDVSKLTFTFFSDDHKERELVTFPSVHEQDDGTILAMCATGTSTRDSLLSWIRFLEKSNPKIKDIPVLFTLRSPVGDIVEVEQENPEEGKVAMKNRTPETDENR